MGEGFSDAMILPPAGVESIFNPMEDEQSLRVRDEERRSTSDLAGSAEAADGASTRSENSTQIFSSIASLAEAASFLTACFTGSSVEDRLLRETNSGELQMMSISSSGQAENSSTCTGSETSCQEEEGQRIISGPGLTGVSLFQSLIIRARNTVRGSADDIGWLQRAKEMPPIEDGTQRFLELLEMVKKKEHKLPDSVVYLLVPGLFSNHGRMYFVNIKSVFSKMGLACHIAKIHSEASVEKNAREIKEYIEEIYWGAKKRVLLFGHSKGGVDSAAALSLYWAELKNKVAGLVLAQSPYAGSPIASDILRQGQLGDYVNLRKITEFLFCKILKGDLQALEDLTYERRKEFLGRHQLPEELPVVCFHTAAAGKVALASLSHVAHAELTAVTKVPVVVPLAAAMAASAQLLRARYGEESDGLVTRRDAEVPGSLAVRPDRALDHGWMVYSALGDDPTQGDAAQVCHALLALLVEVAQSHLHPKND
ncbi:uncharacterized protein LOC144704459 [Wolffia australiana]